jgi:uncharacterized protein (DUF433 family)
MMSKGDLLAVVERDPGKVSGELVFRGTRVPAAALFENLKDGASIEQFLDWFPGVTRAQVEAFLNHEMSVGNSFPGAYQEIVVARQ